MPDCRTIFFVKVLQRMHSEKGNSIMDDHVSRATRMAAVMFLAAGLTGCMAGPTTSQSSMAGFVPPVHPLKDNRVGANGNRLQKDRLDPLKRIAEPADAQSDNAAIVAVTAEIEQEIPELPTRPEVAAVADQRGEEAQGEDAKSDEAQGEESQADEALSEAAHDEDAQDEEVPGRVFISNNQDPVVIYREVAVPVPSDRWPNY